MSTSHDEYPRARQIHFQDEMLVVRLDDGRELRIPLEWYPSLRDATPSQRDDWRLIGGGIGIHWEQLDEDLSVRGMLAPQLGARREPPLRA